MKIKVKEIPRAGVKLDENITAQELGLVEEDAKALGPLHIHGEVFRAKDAVVADVTVEGKFELLCARCLEPVEQDRKDAFEVNLDVDENTEYVDIGEEIRQELLVSLTPIVLCKPDCKGLCPQCGQNLNLKKCECP